MWLYRILFTIDVLAVLVIAYFYLDGLKYADPVESLAFMGPMMIVPILALVGATLLRNRERTGLACVVLAVPAVPALLAAGLIGLLIAFPPDFR